MIALLIGAGNSFGGADDSDWQLLRVLVICSLARTAGSNLDLARNMEATLTNATELEGGGNGETRSRETCVKSALP